MFLDLSVIKSCTLGGKVSFSGKITLEVDPFKSKRVQNVRYKLRMLPSPEVCTNIALLVKIAFLHYFNLSRTLHLHYMTAHSESLLHNIVKSMPL